MVFFFVHDGAHSDPKMRKAGPEAVGVWAQAGAYCQAYNTGGFVPEWYVQSHGRPGTRSAAKLVESELWHPIGTVECDSRDCRERLQQVADEVDEAGWVFHDWDHYQQSPETIKRRKDLNRERQKQWRATHKGKANLRAVADPDA